LGDRLYDLLICIREGMINALVHGCERSAEKFSHLQISLNEAKDTIRVIVDDPGRGHQFDIENPLASLVGKMSNHMGLGIIHHLSNHLAIENRGTSLVFEFKVTPDSPADKETSPS
jgi:anti-sigma regulatory factor (Ser/Thr protein kinase)